MKTTSLSLKLLQPVLATLAIVIVCAFSIRPAQAGYIVTLKQVGPNVVATGSGAIDLTGLSFFEGGSFPGLIAADTGTNKCHAAGQFFPRRQWTD